MAIVKLKAPLAPKVVKMSNKLRNPMKATNTNVIKVPNKRTLMGMRKGLR